MPGVGFIRPAGGGGAGGGSVSVEVSNASPSIGDTITITGTTSNYTPDSYLFFAYNTATNELTFIAEQASNNFDWEILGIFAGNYTIYVLGVENGSPDITAFGTVDITLSSTFLLDTPEGTGANFAFAFYRLRADFSGTIALIRRSSDNAQESFLLDTNNVLSLSSETSGGTVLSTWLGSDDGYLVTGYSQDTAGVTFTATSASNQAKIATSGVIEDLNGVAALLSDQKYYDISTSISARSIFAVAQNDTLNIVNVILATESPLNQVYWGGTFESTTGIGWYDGSTYLGSSVEDFDVHLATFLASTGVYVDGSLEASGNTATLSLNLLGGRAVADGIRHRGKISAIICYSTDKTADRAAIETLINTNYTTSILP